MPDEQVKPVDGPQRQDAPQADSPQSITRPRWPLEWWERPVGSGLVDPVRRDSFSGLRVDHNGTPLGGM